MAKCCKCGKSLLFNKKHPTEYGYCFECGEEKRTQYEIDMYLTYPSSSLHELRMKLDRCKSIPKKLEIYNQMYPFIDMYFERCQEKNVEPKPFIYDYQNEINEYMTIENLFPDVAVKKEQAKYLGDNSQLDKEIKQAIMTSIEYKVKFPNLAPYLEFIIEELEHANI